VGTAGVAIQVKVKGNNKKRIKKWQNKTLLRQPISAVVVTGLV